MDVGTKFDPLTVRLKALLPARMLTGDKELIAGTGLLTVKARLPELPPPGDGLLTDTE